MSDEIEEEKRFLTEAEVAKILMRSVATVKRLRLLGEMPYLPGRPPRIDRGDLEGWISAQKAKAQTKSAEAAEKARLKARPFSELSPAEQLADARAWALRMKLRPPRQRRAKG